MSGHKHQSTVPVGEDGGKGWVSWCMLRGSDLEERVHNRVARNVDLLWRHGLGQQSFRGHSRGGEVEVCDDVREPPEHLFWKGRAYYLQIQGNNGASV